MSLDTYANLQAEVLAKLNRAADSDAAARCPTWITLAEDEMRMSLTRLMVHQGEVRDPAWSIANEYTALPSGFMRQRSLTLTSASPLATLEYVTPKTADEWDPYTSAAQPKFYTIQGNQLRVNPAPNSAYTGTFTYFALPSLSVSVTTNWLLTAHPKLYFKATLAEAYDYYDDSSKYVEAQGDRDRMLTNIYTSDGSDQQGSNLKIRVQGSTP